MLRKFIFAVLVSTLLSGCWPFLSTCGSTWYADAMNPYRERMGIATRDKVQNVHKMNEQVTTAALEGCKQTCSIVTAKGSIALSACCPNKDTLILDQCNSVWASIVKPLEENAQKDFCVLAVEKSISDCKKSGQKDDVCGKNAATILAECPSSTCKARFNEDWIERAQTDFRTFMPICDAFTYDPAKKTFCLSESAKEGRTIIIVNPGTDGPQRGAEQ